MLIKKEYHIELNDNQKLILSKLKENGQGYIIGGFIRDTLLGFKPKDCDFVTDLSLKEVCSIFKDYSVRVIGQHFSIVQITINNEKYEIARMRIDKKCDYKDRTKVDIGFTYDLEEDLQRRDFTINAIAYDGTCLLGQEQSFIDIQNKELRFVGNPHERILEDKLRVLRAIRFISTKQLYINEDIYRILKSCDYYNYISPERIRDEYIKIFQGNIQNKYICDFLNIYHIEKVIKYEDWRLRVAVVFYFKYYNLSKIKDILYSLKLSNKEIKEIICLYKSIYLINRNFDKRTILRNLINNKVEYLYPLLFKDYEEIRHKYPFTFKELSYTIKDLLDFGIPQNSLSVYQNILIDKCLFNKDFKLKDLKDCCNFSLLLSYFRDEVFE